VEKHGGMSPEAAKAYVEEGMMKTEKRYRRDVY
jgi:sulfite reductase alpha subunit-like flavoprotein